MGFPNCEGVDCKGFSGGLLIMWDKSIKVQITLMKNNIICAYLSDHDNNFWISCVYGHLDLHNRHKVRSELIKFAYSINANEEWIALGDFNQVLSVNEKVSFKNTSLRGADLLQDCLNHYKLSEIPPMGQYITWTNNRKGTDLIWERLDRSFANNQWIINHDSA